MNEHDEKTMNELLAILAHNRGILENQKSTRTAILEKAQKDPAYVEAGLELTAANEVISETEQKIRELALTHWINTQEKDVHPSVKVKVFKKFEIVDPAAMRAWVDTNLRDALMVDEKKVKDYATKIGPVEGTEVGEEARAEIASKL